jgi:alkylhydroperoxidase/carboxymuconolactone decarboxylase family protein YurZ
MERQDFSARDAEAKLVFYVLLWKRRDISLQVFDDYWRNVHGPVCARLPAQYQYWQFHVAHSAPPIWTPIPGIDFTGPEESEFDGIAELSFRSEADRTAWFSAAGILMDDERNVFRKAIGYNTRLGNSVTYVDRIEVGDPNGPIDGLKCHVLLKKAAGATVEAFRDHLTRSFARVVSTKREVLKFRLHLFEEVDATRPDAAGVAHSEPPQESYHAAFEVAFPNREQMDAFLASAEYARAARELSKYVAQMRVFPERAPYTFVYRGRMTLAGERSSTVAELIAATGAANQLRQDVTTLMVQGRRPAGMPANAAGANAVHDDPALQAALRALHPAWGDFCIRVAGEAWGLPLIDQRTKALITVAVDVVNGGENGPGAPFEAHVDMALKQGVSRAELEELMLFMSVYAGFNKAASGMGKLQEIGSREGSALRAASLAMLNDREQGAMDVAAATPKAG